jgi:hypothetical protein
VFTVGVRSEGAIDLPVAIVTLAMEECRLWAFLLGVPIPFAIDFGKFDAPFDVRVV